MQNYPIDTSHIAVISETVLALYMLDVIFRQYSKRYASHIAAIFPVIKAYVFNRVITIIKPKILDHRSKLNTLLSNTNVSRKHNLHISLNLLIMSNIIFIYNFIFKKLNLSYIEFRVSNARCTLLN